MKQWKTVLVALSLLAVGCGGDTTVTSEAPAPEVAIERPTATTETPPPTSSVEETEPVASEAESAETGPVECPEGTHVVLGECRSAPEEAPAGEDVTTEDTDAQGECEATGGVWDVDTSTCTQTNPEETPEDETLDAETDNIKDSGGVSEPLDEVGGEPDGTEPSTDTNEDSPAPVVIPTRLVVWEGVSSEDKCVVAGGVWDDGQCLAILYDDPEAAGALVYWHPRLMDAAYNAIDPETVEADRSERLDTGGPWGIYNYHFFYHYNDLEDEQIQYQVMREAASHAVRWVFIPLTDWVWFPHRYDISWTDDPNIVAIRGTYPLGEQRTLLLHTDPEQRSGRADIELPLPLPPPIRPTTPFLEPQWPETAEGLGRDCPPVEEIWGGYGTEVTDPCTLKAVETAVDWMWRGDVGWRQLVIRDGHALADFLQEIEDAHEVEGAYYKAVYGEESRVDGWTYIRDMKWVGYWPGASMIHLEWDLRYPQREFTPEENEARFLYYNTLVKRGYHVPDKYLSDELTLFDVTWAWAKALVVRTADGTWRMSQWSFCSWYEQKIMINRDKLLCPDDPNPHFPDSHRSDSGIHPPSHKNYYQHSRGDTRSTDQYLGIPPS